MTDRQEIWVGIDVGKTAHHACGMDSDGKIVFSQKVANDQAAIEQLVARASNTASEVRWAIDLTSSMPPRCWSRCWWAPASRSSTCRAGWSTG